MPVSAMTRICSRLRRRRTLVKWYPGTRQRDQQWVSASKRPAMPRDSGGATARAPITLHRFSPTLHSYEFTRYRIDCVPR